MAIFIGTYSYFRNQWDYLNYLNYLSHETNVNVLLDFLLTNMANQGRTNIRLEELSSYTKIPVEELRKILQQKKDFSVVPKGYDPITGELVIGINNSQSSKPDIS